MRLFINYNLFAFGIELRKEFLMSFLKLVEALNSLVIVTYKRMNKESVNCGGLVTCCSSLNSVLFISLNDSDKVDDVLVVEVSNLDRLCTVLADYARSLDNIVILKEIKSAVVLNVNNLNVSNIVSKRIDKVNSCKRILVSASLVKKSRLCLL